ncbi:acidic leucine-rich nuclear phosphoprotein 32 family member E [Drosophila subpulchrella]|uniref:acidic leucine-rich nuclear phosphoprotein 32 family member E n=1 Tax=Drosophila subpulchrella TaxID=1486046 RepID=UPI0018A1663A|nr:acidic leucine-rich nuclear phosphoprotein 32 family member E [Drosophila subpulchrella]
MMSIRKSKLLQSLEESVVPIDHEDVVRSIADQIRQPLIDPIERNLGYKEDLSILHLEDAIKFRDTMESLNILPTAESLDEVMPVKDEDLGEMLEALTEVILNEANEGVDEEEDDEEVDEDDDEDEYEDEDEDNDFDNEEEANNDPGEISDQNNSFF